MKAIMVALGLALYVAAMFCTSWRRSDAVLVAWLAGSMMAYGVFA